MNNGNFFGTLVITLVILVVIFLLLREVVCWYWKINQNLALLTEIRDLLASKRIGTMPTAEMPLVTPNGVAPVDLAEKTQLSNGVVESGKSNGRDWTRFSDGTYEITTIGGNKRRFNNLAELKDYIN